MSTTSTLTNDITEIGDLVSLRASVRGTLLTPDDAGYDATRALWNGMIDKRPALILQCTTTDDVIAGLAFARVHDLEIAVRGGGHNVAGSASCDGGLVLGLAPMNDVRVDPHRRRAVAGGGATIGDVDRATVPHGFAAPLGVVSETGIAGLTLGGGMGWMRRKHGLACDALRSVEVVTADGRVLRASTEENEDLFWAMRGGGGNFGVVTRFEFELYPVEPEVFMLATFYPVEAAHEVFDFVQDWGTDAPDEIAPIAVVGHIPEAEFFPAEHHGKPMVALVGPWIGDVEAGAEALASLRTIAEPLADLSGPMPYLDVQQFFDADYPSGGRYYWKAQNLRTLDERAVEDLVLFNASTPSHHTTLDVWLGGGAAARTPAEATAFGDRSTAYGFTVEANWHDPADDEANVAWARECFEVMQRLSAGSSYLNFPGFSEEGETAVQAAHGPNYARLQAIKRAYDPENVFRTHQNVVPAEVA